MESIKYSDLVIDDGAIQKLIGELNTLRQTYEKDVQAIVAACQTLRSSINAVGGQSNLRQAGDEVAKLKAQYDELSKRYAANNVEAEKYKAAIAELRAQMKAEAKAQLENSQGAQQSRESYNRLAAEYTKLKIELNKYSQAEIDNTEALKKKQERAAAVMEQMKALQAATGRYTLDVGNYSKALNGLNWATQQVVREMPSLANSANQFFMAISNNIPIWQDAFKRYREETQSTLQAIQAVIKSVFSWQTAIIVLLTVLSKYGIQLFGWIKETLGLGKAFDAAAEGLKLFREAMADVTGDMAASISDLQVYIYVLQNGNKSLKEQEAIIKLVNQQFSDEIDYMGVTISSTQDLIKYKDQLIEVLIKEAQARGVLSAIEKTAQDIAEREASEERTRLLERVENEKKSYESIQQSYEDIAKHGGFIESLFKRDQAIVEGASKAGISKAEKALEKYDEQTDALREKMRLLVEQTPSIDFSTMVDSGSTTSRQSGGTGEVKNRDLEFIRAAEDAALQAQVDSLDKELEEIQLEYTRRIEDLRAYLQEQRALKEEDREITIAGEKAIESQITSLREVMYQELLGAYIDFMVSEAEAEQKALIDSMDKAAKAELKQAQEQMAKEEEEKKSHRARLKRMEEELRLRYEFEKSQAKLENYGDKDAEKRSLLGAELEYKTGILELWVQDATKTTYEIDRLRNEIKLLVKEMKDEGELSWLDKLQAKLDDALGKGGLRKMTNALSKAVNYAMQQFEEIMQARVELADAMVEQTERELQATKSALDQEIEARNNGYANNVALAQQEYLEKQRLNEQALKEQAEANKQMEAFNTVQQTMSLITASASIFAAMAPLGAIGVGVAIASIATMMAAFIAAKAQAAKATAKTYGEGGTELLSGGSHQSGRDIPLGTMPDGRERRAEGGEYLAIFNKRSSRKYGSVIPNVVDALNRGVFEAKYGNAFRGDGIVVNVDSPTGAIEDFHRDMKKAMNRRAESVLADGTRIVVVGHTKKIIRS